LFQKLRRLLPPKPGGAGAPTYNPSMLEPLLNLLGPAVLDRLTLALNHVLAAEPVAVERLKAHAGRSLRVSLQGWPGFLPPPPPAAWTISPAGLLERVEPPGEASGVLELRVDATQPVQLAAQLLSGDRSAVDLQGDAELASTLAWLMDNVRWDPEDDLARLVGDAPARPMAMALRSLGGGLQAALKTLAPLAARMGGGPR
jgi:ubiquinone biosynthesis accessory factor UbiJ